VNIFHSKLQIATRGKGTIDLTERIQDSILRNNFSEGIVHVFVRHTSASLIIFENADPTARVDLETFFQQLVPENSPYVHDQEGPDDMPSHIRMVLTRTSESIPVHRGQLQLGTWQGVFLYEHRATPHMREIVITGIGN
jgi:secondary thiamine-phosphate synthase enzyme